MIHPEGRIVAIQQQMFFAQLVAQQIQLDPEKILTVISAAGLMLAPDVSEVARDASAVIPTINDYKKQKLQVVPDMAENK